jgi:hypothetical protein
VWRQCNDCIRVKSSPFRTAVCRTGANLLRLACLCYAFVALPHHHPQPGRGDLRAERSVSGRRALARGSASNQPGWPQSRRARPGSWCPQTILYSQPDLKGLRMAAPAGLPVDEAFELSFSPSHSAGDQVHGGKGRLPQPGCAHCSDAAAAARPPATGAGPFVDWLSPLPTPAHPAVAQLRPRLHHLQHLMPLSPVVNRVAAGKPPARRARRSASPVALVPCVILQKSLPAC